MKNIRHKHSVYSNKRIATGKIRQVTDDYQPIHAAVCL